MDFGNQTPEHIELALRLCDIMGISDYNISLFVLRQCNWDIDKAVTQILSNDITQPFPIEQNQQPYKTQYQYMDDEEMEYQYKVSDLETKKQMFDQMNVSFPLDKSLSVPTAIQKKLSAQKALSRQFKSNRNSYQLKLMKQSELLAQQIIKHEQKNHKSTFQNSKKMKKNQEFIAHLHQSFHTGINFTFGTFLLNLVRSYLDKKLFLVYIHRSRLNSSQSVKMTLTQPQIAKFINTTCLAYGMYDNDDDYEIIQKYMQLNQTPGFALFRFNKKTLSQQFISKYSIINSSGQNFIQWLSQHAGVSVQKKQVAKQAKKAQQYTSITQLVDWQNQEYEQLVKNYNLKREQSKIEKDKIQLKMKQIQQMKIKFQEQLQETPGKVITCRIRLPSTGKSLLRRFLLEDKIQTIFDYVDCFGRQEFQYLCSDFDLTQTFPYLSLKQNKQKKIKEVFQESQFENVIVKEL